MAQLVDKQEALTFRFADDGLVPNHPRWPMLVYPGVVRLPDDVDPAAVFEDIFSANGWGDSWRNGIYGFVHYHSRIHEVLGIARGTVKSRTHRALDRLRSAMAGDVGALRLGGGP